MARPRQSQLPDPRVFDINHLRRYTQGHAAFEAELLNLFKAQLPSLMEQIRTGTGGDSWKLALHTLKGSARAIGAVSIGDLALNLEEAGPAASAEMVQRLVDRLEDSIADFVKEAQKLVPDA
jgi:HPt (histidine-containing phosphotransfer) domain-containing protein